MSTLAESSFTVYLLPTKENKFLFAANKRKFAVSLFSKTFLSCCLPLVPFSVGGIPETWCHGHEDMET
jgi:hypothetical protein